MTAALICRQDKFMKLFATVQQLNFLFFLPIIGFFKVIVGRLLLEKGRSGSDVQ